MTKNCVEYILYCGVIYFIGYIVSALFTEAVSTLLIPCIFLNLLLIRIQDFPMEKNKERVMEFS